MFFDAGGLLPLPPNPSFLFGPHEVPAGPAGFPGTGHNRFAIIGVCMFVFGLGYYWVSRDLSRNDFGEAWSNRSCFVFVFFGHAMAREIRFSSAASVP